MGIKIKSLPEDFVVEEIADLPLLEKGEFGVYLLRKKHWNTVGLLLELSNNLKIPLGDFSYGGKKDRHAMTSQYITVKGRKIEEVKQEDYSLVFCGFMDRPMGPDLITANRFRVAVRNLSVEEAQKAGQEAEAIKSPGFANYFDDQRFGSYDVLQGFLAEKLLKGHDNGALKIYLTSFSAQDRKEDKQRKEYFSQHWKDWAACRQMAVTEFEKKSFNHLVRDPNGFLLLLKQIPRERLSIYFSAYQAFIWNDCLRRIISRTAGDALKVYSGVAGEYLFYSRINQENLDYLLKLEIPTLAANLKIPDTLCAAIYALLLEENGLKNPMFNKLKVRQAFFKSSLRCVTVKPGDFSWGISDDQLNSGKKNLSLQFMLPRGSYGTMLVKRIFSKNL